jgi:hypothetical protein
MASINNISISGHKKINPKRMYIYYVMLDIEPEENKSPVTVFLSYAGSTVRNLYAPREVIIEPGSNVGLAYIKVLDDDIRNKKLHISLASSNTNITYGHIEVLITGSTIDAINESERSGNDGRLPFEDTCLDYFFFSPYGHKTKRARNMDE